jgi:hypothetical protein
MELAHKPHSFFGAEGEADVFRLSGGGADEPLLAGPDGKIASVGGRLVVSIEVVDNLHRVHVVLIGGIGHGASKVAYSKGCIDEQL